MDRGPDKNCELAALCMPLACPIRILSIICPYWSSFSFTSPMLRPTRSADCARRVSVIFVSREHGPDHPGHLVCQGDRNQHARFPCDHARQPRPGLATRAPLPMHDGHPPTISRCRMSRCPIFEVRPSFCSRPLECGRGTSPSQAEKSRARRNPRK